MMGLPNIYQEETYVPDNKRVRLDFRCYRTGYTSLEFDSEQVQYMLLEGGRASHLIKGFGTC